MLLRSRLTGANPPLGALVLSLGLAAQPVMAGGHHRGRYVGQLVAVPVASPYVDGGPLTLAPAGGNIGYYVPAAVSLSPTAPAYPGTYGAIAPSYMGSYNPMAPAYAGPNSATAPASFAARTAARAGTYNPTAPAASGATNYVGFTPVESAAYSDSPTLAARLGGNFPLFHKRITASAQLLKKNGVGGSQLLKILKDGALPLMGEIMGVAVPGSGPIFDELMRIIEGIADQVDATATPTSGEGRPARGVGTTINVFLDTKSNPPTATAVVVSGTARPANTDAGDPATSPAPDTRPVRPGAGDAVPSPLRPAGEEPTMKDLKTSIDELAAAVRLAIPAKAPDPAK